MYVKNRYLKISPEGNVTGTNEDESEYTILQRSSVNTGQVKFQGVATCMFLCLDSCGLLYGSQEWDEECIFHEIIEQHHYNTYSSAKYSNDKRTLYLALNKYGLSRRVQLRGKQPLGKMSMYTRVLTQPVSNKKVEKMENQPMRHHQLCPSHLDNRNRKRNRKKKRRKCGGAAENDSPEKQVVKRKPHNPDNKSLRKKGGRKRKHPTEALGFVEHTTSLPSEDNSKLSDVQMVEIDET